MTERAFPTDRNHRADSPGESGRDTDPIRTLHKRRAEDIGAMFSAIADRYDLMNAIMTGGRDRDWRRRVVDLCHPEPGQRILDLGTGTGELALAFGQAASGLDIWASDVSMEMMSLARTKPGAAPIRFVQADALRLPLPNNHFDVVVSAFLMRNLPDPETAVQEQVRLLKPGGRLVFLEIVPPEFTWLGSAYKFFMFSVVPRLGRLLSGSATAYAYLPSSTQVYESPFAMLSMLREAGLHQTAFATCMANTISIHHGRKPTLTDEN